MRLIEAIVPEKYASDMRQLLKELNVLDYWDSALSDLRVSFRLLVHTDMVELVMDKLESHFSFEDEFRLVLYVPEAVHPAPVARPTGSLLARLGFRFVRVSRQELYHDVYDACGVTPLFLAMVVLSTVVAAAGLLQDNVAAIIGAMVIAPLLGPNAALALASTLADYKLARRALSSSLVGVSLAFAMAYAVGASIDVNPEISEIASRTRMSLWDISIALAAGVAGSLAFVSGAPTSLVGVMVAVALLPPTVVLGMLVGAGEWNLARGALLILVANLTSLNVSGIVTFLALGLRPRLWSRVEGAKNLAVLMLLIWVAILAAIVWVIVRSQAV